MRTAYQYRLRPTKAQVSMLESWLELLCRQYNYRLAERFNWWELNRCDIDRCSLVSCSIEPPKDRPSFYSQKRDLVESKKLFPEYKALHSQVLQDCTQRVEKTFDRWLRGNSIGNRSGKPRFKGKGRYRSFTYPQMKQECIQGNKVNLPKIGLVKFIQHRPIPEGFRIKTATITRKADGWYITLSLKDDTVPTLTPDLDPDNTVGIDVGLKEFLVTSEGQAVPIPQHYRKREKRLKRLSRSVTRKRKGSSNRRKAVEKLARFQQTTANQRKDFHYKTAGELLNNYDVIAHEDLNIKGLARTRLAKSILDAGWSQFISILTTKAESAGKLVVGVNPRGTSQNCSGCGERVTKTLADRVHSCPNCGLEIDRDYNAAINILNLAAGHSVSKACGVRRNSGPAILLAS